MTSSPESSSAPPQSARHPHRRSVLTGVAGALLAAVARPRPALASPLRLAARAAEAMLLPGKRTPVLAFDGAVPGPLLRMRHGETLPVRFENRTDQPMTLHWSGMRVSNRVDGVAGLTQAPVAPGALSDFELAPPDPGLFIYRPSVPGRTGDLVARGLSGLIVVEDADQRPVDADVVLGLTDWLLDESGGIVSPSVSVLNAGRLGNLVTVNGAAKAHEASLPRGAKLRLRIANTAPARVMSLRIEGAKAYVAAVDGHPTDVFEPLRSTFPLGPGNRLELFVEMPVEPGAVVRLLAQVGTGFEVAVFRTTGELSPLADTPFRPLPLNPRLPAEIRLQSALRTNFTIEGGPRPGLAAPLPWHVNGKPGSLARGGGIFSVGRDRPVVMTVANRTELPQTIHLHGHAFRVLHALDDGWDPYWLDTVTVPAGKTVRIAFVADNPGRWLIASAVLDRLDQGLYGWFEVA